MIAWIITMVFGLAMDIAGAILIISPLWKVYALNSLQHFVSDIHRTKESIKMYEEDVEEDTNPDSMFYDTDGKEKRISQLATTKSLRKYEQEDLIRLERDFQNGVLENDEIVKRKTRQSAYWGLTFLIIGFTLQIISNIQQWNLP